MDRDQHAHQEHEIQRPVQFEADAAEDISDDEAEKNNQNNADQRGPDAVHHGFGQMIVRVGEDPLVVDQIGMLWKSDDVCIKDPFFLEGGITHPDKRENTGK